MQTLSTSRSCCWHPIIPAPHRLLAGVLSMLWLALPVSASADSENPDLSDFAFLTGYWKGTGFGGVSEEIWMPGSDGSMFGIFKQSSDAGITFTEFMEITRLADQYVLRLKHFNPDFTGWEAKEDFVTFRLQSVSPGKAVFNGLSYTLVDATTLRIELRLRESDGSINTEVFEFRKLEI